MMYFIVQTSPLCPLLPHFLDWKEVIDPQHIKVGHSHHLPVRQKIYYKSEETMVFPDLITYPFRMISPPMKNVIAMYQPETIFKEMVLVDQNSKISGEARIYYIPILEELDCLDRETLAKPGPLKNPAISPYKQISQDIFLVRKGHDAYMMANLDVVESMLRRGVSGIELMEVSVK